MNSTLRLKRHRDLRNKVSGTSARPRISVYRSLKHIFVQVIDDTTHTTLIGLSDKACKPGLTGLERSEAVATSVADQLKAKKITAVVFDRGGFKYHGRVKQIADTLRASGITL